MSAVAQVEVTLKDNLSGKLKDATQAVKETADAEKKAAQAAKELAKEQAQIAQAAKRLEDLANRGNGVAKLATELRRTRQEIALLAAKTGDQAGAAAATAAAEAQFATKLQELTTAQKAAKEGSDKLADATGKSGDAAQKAGGNFDLTGKMARDLGNQFKVATNESAKASDRFGAVGGAAGKLAGGLDMLVPGLGAVATGVADVADMGEVGAVGMEVLGASVATLGSVLVALLVPIAAVAAAYTVFSNAAYTADTDIQNLDRAALKQAGNLKLSADRVKELTDAWQSFLDIQQDVQNKIDIINGKTTAAQMEGAAKIQQQADAARPVLAELGNRVAQLQRALDAAKRQSAGGADVTAEERAAAIKAEPRLQAELKKTQTELDAKKAALARAAEEIQLYADYVDETAKATEEQRKKEEASRTAAQQKTNMDREAANAARDRAEAIELLADTIASADPVSQENRRYELQVQSIQEAIRLSGDQEEGQRALNVALAEHEERLQAIADQQKKKAEDAEKAAAAEKKQIQDAAQAEQDRLRKEAEQKARLAAEEGARKRQKATGTVDMVGSVMGGGFAALGWIGQITQTVIGLVTGIVDETGNGIIDKLHETMMEFFSDLGGLGAELADSMLRSVVEGIPAAFQGIAGLLGGLLAEDSLKAILEGSARMIPEILVAVFRLIIADVPRIVAELIRTIFSKEFWVDVLKGFADGIKEAFKGLVGANSDQSKGGRVVAGVATLGLSEALRAATKGRYATGAGNIREDGLYYLHKGETAIVPSNGVQPSSRPSGGGVNVVVNISGYMASNTEDLARTIRQAVQRGVKLA